MTTLNEAQRAINVDGSVQNIRTLFGLSQDEPKPRAKNTTRRTLLPSKSDGVDNIAERWFKQIEEQVELISDIEKGATRDKLLHMASKNIIRKTEHITLELIKQANMIKAMRCLEYPSDSDSECEEEDILMNDSQQEENQEEVQEEKEDQADPALVEQLKAQVEQRNDKAVADMDQPLMEAYLQKAEDYIVRKAIDQDKKNLKSDVTEEINKQPPDSSLRHFFFYSHVYQKCYRQVKRLPQRDLLSLLRRFKGLPYDEWQNEQRKTVTLYHRGESYTQKKRQAREITIQKLKKLEGCKVVRGRNMIYFHFPKWTDAAMVLWMLRSAEIFIPRHLRGLSTYTTRQWKRRKYLARLRKQYDRDNTQGPGENKARQIERARQYKATRKARKHA